MADACALITQTPNLTASDSTSGSAELPRVRITGIDLPATTAFQYKEPSEDQAYMRSDEYDQLIADPTGFLYNVWLPRVADDVVPIGQRLYDRKPIGSEIEAGSTK